MRRGSPLRRNEARYLLRHLDHEVVVLPCGRYTLGRTPFQLLDAYHICSFLKRTL